MTVLLPCPDRIPPVAVPKFAQCCGMTEGHGHSLYPLAEISIVLSLTASLGLLLFLSWRPGGVTSVAP
jgi:hypothetical protein